MINRITIKKLLEVLQLIELMEAVYRLNNKDFVGAFSAFSRAIFIEKITVKILNHLSKSISSTFHDLGIAHTGFIPDEIFGFAAIRNKIRGLSAFITDNYSYISKIPETFAFFLPQSIKDLYTSVAIEFTSTNAQIAHILATGWCRNYLDLHLTGMNNQDAKIFIAALKTGHIPMGLKLSYDESKVSPALNAEIRALLRKNDLKCINQAALACVTLQQGNRDESNLLAMLPQEMLAQIYEYVFPFPEDKPKLKNFLNNASSFFARKQKEIPLLPRAGEGPGMRA